MHSRLPTGAVISTDAIDARRDAICMSEAFAVDLCVIGFGLAGLSFAAGAVQNGYAPSKSLLTAAKLDRCGG
jgi:hypothetical protein